LKQIISNVYLVNRNIYEKVLTILHVCNKFMITINLKFC